MEWGTGGAWGWIGRGRVEEVAFCCCYCIVGSQKGNVLVTNEAGTRDSFSRSTGGRLSERLIQVVVRATRQVQTGPIEGTVALISQISKGSPGSKSPFFKVPSGPRDTNEISIYAGLSAPQRRNVSRGHPSSTW